MNRERPRRYVHNIPAARDLRRQSTETEGLLWERLRDRRLLGLKFRRQHAIGRYVVDFYCHELRLIVEVDGGVHDEPEQRALDAERQSELEALGLSFVRVPTDSVSNDIEAVLAMIEDEITRRGSGSQAGSGDKAGA